MEISRHVVSLSLAKKLKELGVKQESLFYYSITEKDSDYWGDEDTPIYDEEIIFMGNKKVIDSSIQIYYSAFLASELGEILPASLGNQTWLSYTKSYNGWKGVCETLSYTKWEQDKAAGQLLLKKVHEISNEPYREYEPQVVTEVDTRAKMLIYLYEHKLLPIKNQP